MAKYRLAAAMVVVVFTGVIGALAGKPGEGIDVGKLLLRPYAGIAASYDSNPALRRKDLREEDDIYLSESVGINLLFPTRQFDLNGSVYLVHRDYLQEDANDQGIPGRPVEDHTDVGQSLTLTTGDRDSLLITVSESFQRVSDDTIRPETEILLNEPTQSSYPLDERASRIKRGQYTGSITLGRDLTDKVDAGVGWHLNGTQYKTGRLLDHSENSLHADVGFGVTDKSSLFLRGQYGVHDSAAFKGLAHARTLLFGWRTDFTAKTSFNGGVGLEQYDPPGLPSDEMVSFNVGWGWRMNRKWQFSANGGNSAEPSTIEQNNWRLMTSLSGDANYRFSQKLSCTFGLAYRRDKYKYAYTLEDKQHPVDRSVPFDLRNYNQVEYEGHNALDHQDFVGRVGLSYSPFRCVSLNVNASQEIFNSNYPNEDFGQTRIGAGARVIY